jgi:hypothetical protein
LQRTDTNERMEVLELRDVAAPDLRGALREMEAVAMACPRCTKPFYHASINTRAEERLTPAQRLQAIDRLERELGLSGQPRVVVVHIKKDREHCHIVWQRVDIDLLRTISDSHNFRKHEIVARELERSFGHERVQGAHIERDGQARPERTPGHDEMQQAERTGLTPKQAKAQLTALWTRTDSGQAFAAALNEQGWCLCRGDRRDFVAIDPYGGTHSLARRIEGAKAADIRQRLADLDAAALPTVAEARAARSKESAMTQEPPGDDLSQQQPDREAHRLRELREHEARAAAYRLAQEQAAEQTKQQQARKPPSEETLQQQADREAHRLRELQQQEERAKAYRQGKEQEAEEAKRSQAAHRSAEELRARNGDISSASARYAIALGENYDIRDPYGSLAKSAMSEYALFHRNQEKLREEMAKEQDPAQRRVIELRKNIEACDYMAITGERLAGISVAIAGRESPQAALDRERATAYRDQATALRAERSALIEANRQRERITGAERPQEQAAAAERPSATARSDDAKRAREAEETASARATGRKEGKDGEAAEMTEGRQAKYDRLRQGLGAARQAQQQDQSKGGGRGRSER